MNDLVKKTVDAIETAFEDASSDLYIKRDEVVLDLLAGWLKGYIVEVTTRDVGYDCSTVPVNTGEVASFEAIPTLSVWMRMGTGDQVATHISGFGMAATRYHEKVKEGIEDIVDEFVHNFLGEELTEDDYDTLFEVRHEIEGLPACRIGELEIDVDGEIVMDGYGYIAEIGDLSFEEWTSEVNLDLLSKYDFVKSIYQKRLLQEKTNPSNGAQHVSRL